MNRRTFMTNVSIAAGTAATVRIADGFPGIVSAQARVAQDPVVETAAGRVRGRVDSGVYVFKDIPYGASTAGETRKR